MARPEILKTDAGQPPTERLQVCNERGELEEVEVARERPLTLYLDKFEIVTLMTLGSHPELLVLGYLKNQGLVSSLDEIVAVEVDWEVEAAAVTTRHRSTDHLPAKLAKRIVTSGCGQGTLFGELLDHVEPVGPYTVRQSVIYELLRNMRDYNEVYKRAGGVHGCALCWGSEVLFFCEDVGRHNAVDTLAGYMWLEGIAGQDKILYTTGRLTSEMVLKAAQMQVPVLISRSSANAAGVEIARRAGMTLIGRAKGRQFLVYHGAENLIYDAIPRR